MNENPVNEQPARRRARHSLFWPVVLVAAGIVWLLVNVGIMDTANLNVLFKIWPVLLIVIGVDVLFGRRSAVIGAAIALVGIAVVIGLMLIGPSQGWSDETTLHTQLLSEPVGQATSALVELDLSDPSTELTVQPGADSLISADMRHRGTAALKVEGSERKSVRLSYESRAAIFDWATGDQAHWAIDLSDRIPMTMVVNGGSGSLSLDLMGLQLEGLTLDIGSGSADLQLPTGTYAAKVEGGSGSLSSNIAAGTRAQLDLDVGSGSVSVAVEPGAAVELTLRGGSGSFSLGSPSDAAIRVEVNDSGSGSVNVPSSLQTVERGEGDRGIWESPTFATAAERIIVRVESVGSGSISVQ